jgi:predicted acetyltransferase
MYLSSPSRQYKETFLKALQEEVQTEGDQMSHKIQNIVADFDGFLQRLSDMERGINIAPHLVPASSFWLIDNGEYIGSLSLRHGLNDDLFHFGGHIGYDIRPSKRRKGYGKEILRLGLEKARERGLRRVLITCDETNIGSKKIIEANGGVFENAVTQEGSPVKKLRYWIDLP